MNSSRKDYTRVWIGDGRFYITGGTLMPITANTRILLCSILGQSEFAVFMGADAMISKPVTPQAFLKALDQQAALMEKGSH